MKENKSLLFGTICIVILIFIALIGPYLPFVDSDLSEEFIRRDQGKLDIAPFPPSSLNPFGTDHFGRDILSFIIIGTKETLAIVLGITFIRFLIAVPLGFFAKYLKPVRMLLNGWNQLFSYVPPLFMIVMIISLPLFIFIDFRLIWLILVIALLEVGRVATIVYEKTNALANTEFILAGTMVGCTLLNLFKRHYWPHLRPQIITNFANDLGRTMFLIGQLGFIKISITYSIGTFGIKSTSTAWPLLFERVLYDIYGEQWIPFFTCLPIAFTVFAFYMFGNGLRRYFEVRYTHI